MADHHSIPVTDMASNEQSMGQTGSNANQGTDDTTPFAPNDRSLLLLPASYRLDNDLYAANASVETCLKQELDLDRLAKIHGWLWIVGLPLPPRALHHQLLLGREIFITERMDMNLVWTTGRIFLKPMPRFLLDPGFWTNYLQDDYSPDNAAGQNGQGEQIPAALRRTLRQRALGFLFSYAALIAHESDFRIAKEKHLLPQEAEWLKWRDFVKQLCPSDIYGYIDPRFYHGELRLSRLNKIYMFWKTPLRPYMSHWTQYGAFFHDNFTWLASVTVFIVVVLTAMQVGLAIDALKLNNAFSMASYGFAVFAILGPLIAVSLIILVFCGIFVYALINTIHKNKARKRRFKAACAQ